MAQEESRYTPRKAKKTEAPGIIPPPSKKVKKQEGPARKPPAEQPGKTYRYGDDSKPPVLIIGLLLVLIAVIGGALVLLILHSPEMNGNGVAPDVPADNGNGIEDPEECDEQCLYDRALAHQDFSGCQLISDENLEQECYYHLSMVSREACMSLEDESRKGQCLNHFAVADGDIGLCDLLVNGREECRLAVDPCISSADRPLCLALLEKDPGFCEGDSACLLNYGFMRSSTDACEMISGAAMSKACVSTLLAKDKCYELPSLSERDLCYHLYATYSKDYSICTNIRTDSHYAVDCYAYFAVENEDLRICNAFHLNDRWSCYSQYALASGDLEACRRIDPLATTFRFSCAFEYAKHYGNAAACDVIEQLSSRSTCYQGVIIYSNQNLDWAYCGDVINFDWRNKCYIEAAKLYDDISLCRYTQNGYAEEMCRTAYELNKSG